MSTKTVSRGTAKPKAARVAEHLQRIAQALPEPTPAAPDHAREVATPRTEYADMLGEFKDFASRCCAMLDAIDSRLREGESATAENLVRVFETFAHAKYSELAGMQRIIAGARA
jgi:hypothetical protein